MIKQADISTYIKLLKKLQRRQRKQSPKLMKKSFEYYRDSDHPLMENTQKEKNWIKLEAAASQGLPKKKIRILKSQFSQNSFSYDEIENKKVKIFEHSPPNFENRQNNCKTQTSIKKSKGLNSFKSPVLVQRSIEGLSARPAIRYESKNIVIPATRKLIEEESLLFKNKKNLKLKPSRIIRAIPLSQTKKNCKRMTIKKLPWKLCETKQFDELEPGRQMQLKKRSNDAVTQFREKIESKAYSEIQGWQQEKLEDEEDEQLIYKFY